MKIKYFKYLHFGWNWKLLKDKLFNKFHFIDYDLILTEEMKYINTDENQEDINKLLGLRNNIFTNENSICLGWNYKPNLNQFGLYIYMHNCTLESTNLIIINNTTRAFHLGDFSVGDIVQFSISDYTSYLTVSFRLRHESRCNFIIQKDNSILYNRLMTGYFGGQETPNNDFSIIIGKLSLLNGDNSRFW